jgi:uncharacterized membrane protein YidH (DUF202 family)
MSNLKLLAVLLIVVGVFGLAYGTFSYTRQTHDIKLGSMEMTVQEKESVNIPVWFGVGAVGLGAFLLLSGKRTA